MKPLIESLMNIAIGYVVALLSQIVIFPMFDIHVPIATNIWIGLWFTVISLVRSYIIRRWFNARMYNAVSLFDEQIYRTNHAQLLNK